MKKIAIITSGEGAATNRLVELFNEGNRIRVELVMKNPDFSERDYASVLSQAGVELLALDGYEGVLPVELYDMFSGRIIKLTSPEEAPREVVSALSEAATSGKRETYTHDTLTSDPEGEAEVMVEKAETEGEGEPKSADEEWAETLKMTFDKDRLATTPPPMPKRGGQRPVDPQFGGMPFRGPRPDYHSATQPENSEPMPKSYMILSVIMTIFCCTIPGIVAIIFSSQVASRYAMGDMAGAVKASRNAEIWIIVSFVLGVISATLWLPIAML